MTRTFIYQNVRFQQEITLDTNIEFAPGGTVAQRYHTLVVSRLPGLGESVNRGYQRTYVVRHSEIKEKVRESEKAAQTWVDGNDPNGPLVEELVALGFTK